MPNGQTHVVTAMIAGGVGGVVGEKAVVIPSDFKTESRNKKTRGTGCRVKPGMTNKPGRDKDCGSENIGRSVLGKLLENGRLIYSNKRR
jgi:hypothetical protein